LAYRFGFNGQERDDEVAGIGNTMTAEFWEYDARLGRRWNVDPVTKPWMSSYHAFSNKPILNVDPNGANDDNYVVDENGKHLRTEENDDPDKLVVENSKTKEIKEYTFNDPLNDVAWVKDAIKNKSAIKIQIISKDVFNSMLDESGVRKKENRDNWYDFAEKQSPPGGSMDYQKFFSLDAFTIFEGQDVAFNRYDAGNFSWGSGMEELGVPLVISRIAAEYVAFNYAKKWYSATLGQRGSGKEWDDNASIFSAKYWNQKSWEGDDSADQIAIIRGYLYEH